jgi:predicted PurR-regulated permease PerM
MRQNVGMKSKENTVRNVIGYALFLMYAVGGLMTIGLFVFGYRDAAGLAFLCVLAGSVIPLFLRLLLHISKK